MIKLVDNLDFIGNISSGVDYIINNDLDELKKEVELLKRKTDPEYARECVIKELLEEYKKLVGTDIWWDACRTWVNKRTDEILIKYEYVFNNHKYMGYEFGDILVGDPNISFCNMDVCDVIISTGSGREISINNLLNPNPYIKGYEFEKFVIEFCEKQ